MPESLTAPVRERPEPRTGGALGAALFSALMFGAFVRFSLLFPFALLAPFPAERMETFPVSPRVNSTAVDDADLTRPVAPEPDPGQMRLF